MATPHTTNGQYTNPEVRFEHTDIDLATVVRYGGAFVVLVAASLAVVVGLFFMLKKDEVARKKTTLPPAAVDQDEGRLPPEPRLEAVEDLREKRRPQLAPPRARDYLEPQENKLAGGDPAKGEMPIEKAIDAVAGKLPSRKSPGAGASNPLRDAMPSQASSGREPAGGR
jgi:hypothetical protein